MVIPNTSLDIDCRLKINDENIIGIIVTDHRHARQL